MKITVMLILASLTVALGVPSQNRPTRQEQKPVVGRSNDNSNQQNPVNFGFPTFGNGGSWPNFGAQGLGNLGQQSAVGTFPTRFDFGMPSMPKIEGAETLEASAGMSCSFQNGKKKCTQY